jgi:hypothetical protein
MGPKAQGSTWNILKPANYFRLISCERHNIPWVVQSLMLEISTKGEDHAFDSLLYACFAFFACLLVAAQGN